MPDALVRALIADDEPSARDAVTTLLAEYSTISVVGSASNGRETVDRVRALAPDLLFLDIQMPDLDGFGVIDALGAAVPRGVVFVTAHDEHALRAFDVHALDYVLKPFGRPRFDAAVQRALQRLDEIDALTMQRTMASIADDRRAASEPAGELSGDASPRRIGVRSGSRTAIVDVDSIDWVEADGDYACIHAGANRYVVSQRMQSLERLLDGTTFVRAHRSLIINIHRVRALHRDAEGGGSAVLHDGVTLRVARGRWDAVTRALGIARV